MNPLVVSTIKHIEDKSPRVVSLSWIELCNRLSRHTAYAAKEQAALWCPTAWVEGRKREKMNLEKGNLLDVSCFVGEFDDGTVPASLMDRWKADNGDPLAFVIHSSYNHHTDAPRWRCVFPLTTPVPADQWKTEIWPRLSYWLFNNRNDAAAKDAARFYFVPSCPADRLEMAFCDMEAHGVFLDPYSIPPIPEQARPTPKPTGTRGTGEGRPGDDFNEKATQDDVLAILLRVGWREQRRDGDTISVIRPGKPFDIRSGTIGHIAPNVFYCFSDNAQPLTHDRAYDPFSLFAILECNSDFKEAARRKASEGFGSQKTGRKTKVPGGDPIDGQEPSPKVLDPDSGLPQIETNPYRRLRDISTDGLEALKGANNPPRLFARDGKLVHVAITEKDTVRIEDTSNEDFRAELERMADWICTTEKKGVLPSPPRKNIVEDMRSLLRIRHWGDIPPLETVVTAPIVAANGELMTTPGYLPDARVYYHGEKFQLPDTSPTVENLAIAKDLILGNLLFDFPFVDDNSRANAVALLLLPFVRLMINGPTPLHLIDAPAQGSGKSLLAEVIGSVFLGKADATVIPKKGEEDEWRKSLTSSLKSGQAIVWYDNLKTKLDSGPLAHAITASVWTDRAMGTQNQVNLPVRCVWIITGNNIETDDDFPRRCVWIRIDTQEERPENRVGFKNPDLRGFVADNRLALIGACLTLIRNWLENGRPNWNGLLMGSFESYCRVMGGILGANDIPGFLLNREELYERADPDRQRWETFFEAWYDARQEQETSAKDVIDIAVANFIVPSNERGDLNYFGKQLRKYADRIIGGYRLTQTREKRRVQQYSLKKIPPKSKNDAPPTTPLPLKPVQQVHQVHQSIPKRESYKSVEDECGLEIGFNNTIPAETDALDALDAPVVVDPRKLALESLIKRTSADVQAGKVPAKLTEAEAVVLPDGLTTTNPAASFASAWSDAELFKKSNPAGWHLTEGGKRVTATMIVISRWWVRWCEDNPKTEKRKEANG